MLMKLPRTCSTDGSCLSTYDLIVTLLSSSYVRCFSFLTSIIPDFMSVTAAPFPHPLQLVTPSDSYYNLYSWLRLTWLSQATSKETNSVKLDWVTKHRWRSQTLIKAKNYAGFDSFIVRWLLENTSNPISFPKVGSLQQDSHIYSYVPSLGNCDTPGRKSDLILLAGYLTAQVFFRHAN